MTDNETPEVHLPVARPIYDTAPLLTDFQSADSDEYDMFSSVTLTPSKANTTADISSKRSLIELGIVTFFLFLPMLIKKILTLFGVDLPLGYWLYLQVLLSGSLLIFVTWFLIHRDGQTLRTLGLRFDSLGIECKSTILAFILLATVYGLSTVELVYFFPDLAFDMINEKAKIKDLFTPLPFAPRLLFVLFVGFYEEFLFRGFAITRLNVLCKYPWISIVVSSVLFGLVHSYQQPVGIVIITLLALIFGGMYVVRGRLLAVMLSHALWDLIMLSQI